MRTIGVDIGTTSVSAQVISLKNGDVLHTYSFDHKSQIPDDKYPEAYAVDAERLVELALGLINSACSAYPGISSIGFTGQMHGIVCLDCNMNCISPLYTWQNDFGNIICENGESICESVYSLCGEKIPTGYGILTLYALKKLCTRFNSLL